MFDRIKKAFVRPDKDAGVTPSQMAHGPVSEWAATQGFAFSTDATGQTVRLQGKVHDRIWRMEVGPPSRDYVRGEEIRGRADLGVDEDVAVLLINRPLKEALEKQAYQMYTDDLQTSVNAGLTEEMRWLSMYDEVGWESLPDAFWDRYAILTDKRAHALAWVDPMLAQTMLDWPKPAPTSEVPFVMMLHVGKAYLRMEHLPTDMPTLQHAARIFTSACDLAIGSFAGKGGR